MNLTLKIFLVIFLLIITIILLNTIKRKNISMKYVTVWIFTLILLFIFALFPSILITVSNFFGFEATSNMVFLIGYFMLFYVVFNQSIELSKQKKEIVKFPKRLKTQGFEQNVENVDIVDKRNFRPKKQGKE